VEFAQVPLPPGGAGPALLIGARPGGGVAEEGVGRFLGHDIEPCVGCIHGLFKHLLNVRREVPLIRLRRQQVIATLASACRHSVSFWRFSKEPGPLQRASPTRLPPAAGAPWNLATRSRFLGGHQGRPVVGAQRDLRGE
jgi:hypothetical protein